MGHRVKVFVPSVHKRLVSELERIEKEISNLSVFENGIKTEFWKRIQAKFDRDLKKCESQLDNFENLPDRAVLILLSKRQALRGFLDVKGFVASRSMLEQMLANKRAEIENYGERKSRNS